MQRGVGSLSEAFLILEDSLCCQKEGRQFGSSEENF